MPRSHAASLGLVLRADSRITAPWEGNLNMITRAGVLRHRLFQSELDISLPRVDIAAISKAASENGDIQRAVGTAWLLFLISTAVFWLTVFELNGTVRVVATLLFAITAPGWTITAFLLPLEPAMEWSLTVAFSVSISITLSMFMLLGGWWAPVGMVLGLSCVVAVLQILHISVLSQRRRFWLDDAYSGNVETTLGLTSVRAGVPRGIRSLSEAWSRLKRRLFETRAISASRPKYRLRLGIRSDARSGPILRLANPAQEEIPPQRSLQAIQQPSTQEMANPGAPDPSAVEEKKAGQVAADAEKAHKDKEITKSERNSARVYRMRIETAQLPDKVRKAALREVGELEQTSDQSTESGAIRAWLDTILDLPWSSMTLDTIAIQGERKVDSAAAVDEKSDTEKVDPAGTNRKMVYRQKVDVIRTAEIVWPLPPWAADIEMVGGGEG